MKLRVRDLSVKLGGAPLLHSLSLTLEQTDRIALLGLNGAGKTTFLKALMGVIPYRGEVQAGERDLKRVSFSERAKLISYSPQKRAFPQDLTVFEYVLMGATPYLPFFGYPGKNAREEAKKALIYCRIAALRTRFVSSLSGGEQQMVFLARALVQKAPFLLLDEPFSHLDFRAAHTVVERISSFAKRVGVGLLITLHDPNLALRFADKIVIIHNRTLLARLNTHKDGFLDAYDGALKTIYDNGTKMVFCEGRPIIVAQETDQRIG